MRCLMLCFFLVHLLHGQSDASVDFKRINVDIIPVMDKEQLQGKGTYEFELRKKVDSIFLDAVNITFLQVVLNGKEVAFSNSGKRLGIRAPKKIGHHELYIRYEAKPRQTVYFIQGKAINRPTVVQGPFTESDIDYVGFENPIFQLWTQGQGKYTSHWLPSIDDMTDKIEFDVSFLVNTGYQVIANGKLVEKTTKDQLTHWRFDMGNPMSSYLVAFVIGDFDKKVLQSKSGVPMELYYEPKDSLKFEPTYRYSKEIFDFLEAEIGVPYPWQNYKQVPVQDFLYAGMENTGCTIFSNQYVIDSTAFVDKNYVNVNAHELAHQWFGNLVTEVSGEHHWLHEGFATYYAYLAERMLFGDEHFYWKLFETAKTLKARSEMGEGQALTNPNASSLTFYEKGSWALVMLKNEVGGEAFKKGVKSYLQRHGFKNVTIADFLKAMESASNKDLSNFKTEWLMSDKFPWEAVKAKLRAASAHIDRLFTMEEDLAQAQSDDIDYMGYWQDSSSSQFKASFIKEYHRILPDSILNQAFDSDDILVRQALATSLLGISGARVLNEPMIAKYESLLHDSSYVTLEHALLKLWSNFPEKRTLYLEKTKNIHGLPNKNIRLLWLTLALVTPDYQALDKQAFYQELNGYTGTTEHFEVRQLAFEYLYQIQALSDTALMNLVKACDHHVWQFKKSSRNLLTTLVANNELKNRLLALKDSLNEKEQKVLQKIMGQ